MGGDSAASFAMSLRSRIRHIVPDVAGWNSWPGASVNLLLFALAALTGEWIVHQIQYEIEYGARFGQVMATTPHHLYMLPAGLGLGSFGLTALTSIALLIVLACVRRARLLAALPQRLQRRIPSAYPRLPVGRVWRLALVLTSLQVMLYLLQENLESAAVGNGWPLLRVLLPPIHTTAVPLHLLLALCMALILCGASAWLRGSRQALAAAGALVRLSLARSPRLLRLRPTQAHLPNLRPVAGSLGLRSPPLSA